MKNTLKQQSGVVLLVSLILLLLLAVLGVTSMKSAILEEKIAGNYRAHSLAFQNAERVLRYAEQELISQAIAPTAGSMWIAAWAAGGGGSRQVEVLEAWSPTNTDLGNNAEWWKGKSTSWWGNNAITSNDLPAGLYIIEYKEHIAGSLTVGGTGGGGGGGKHYYRITALGAGNYTAQKSLVLLQAIVVRGG